MEEYLVLYPNGQLKWIQTPHSLLAKTFYEAIGCDDLEHVNLPYGFGCVVDGSGKVKVDPQPLNPLASRLYPGSFHGHPLVGPVIFVRIDLIDGEFDWAPLQSRDLVILELLLGKQIPAHV